MKSKIDYRKEFEEEQFKLWLIDRFYPLARKQVTAEMLSQYGRWGCLFKGKEQEKRIFKRLGEMIKIAGLKTRNKK